MARIIRFFSRVCISLCVLDIYEALPGLDTLTALPFMKPE